MHIKLGMKRFVIFILLLTCNVVVFAQCAMCKASAETSVGAGAKDVATINRGIIYLMMGPYILVSIVAFIWWWHYRKRKLQQTS